jgi:hypothetical protein
MDNHFSGLRAGRVGLAVVATLAAGWLAGCGKIDDNALSATFDKSMHDSCVSTASAKPGVQVSAAEAYCSCVVTQLDAIPIAQRMTLSPTSDKITSAENVCNAQVAGTATPAASNDTTTPPAMPAPATNSGE